MTGLGVAEAEAALDAAAEAETVSLGVATEEAEVPRLVSRLLATRRKQSAKAQHRAAAQHCASGQKSGSHGNVFLISVWCVKGECCLDVEFFEV